MKACVLYSGGKDSSLMGVILTRLGYDVELVTANFGVYDSFYPARNSAESINLKHRVLNLDVSILERAVDMIMEDGFPNEGIKLIHKEVVEAVADEYDVVADGTRRDDKTPVKYLVGNLFELKNEKSNKETSSDYEVEIRCLIDQKGGNSSEIFPEHYQTNVVGLK